MGMIAICSWIVLFFTGTKFSKSAGECLPTSTVAARSLADCINTCAAEAHCTHAAFYRDQCYLTIQSDDSIDQTIDEGCWSKNVY